MNRTSSIRTSLLSICVAASFALPAAAMPVTPQAPLQASQQASPDIIKVRKHRRDRFERRGNRAYWRGHRGYRAHRPGYRKYNGWWFPPAAFALGAIIGGVTNAPRLGDEHVRWCYNRYRSYRASDNTFQPYNGPRRQCWSPYN